MRLKVNTRIAYRLNAEDYVFDVGEHDVPDALAEIALGAGWAELAGKSPPANKARKAAPENK